MRFMDRIVNHYKLCFFTIKLRRLEQKPSHAKIQNKVHQRDKITYNNKLKVYNMLKESKKKQAQSKYSNILLQNTTC